MCDVKSGGLRVFFDRSDLMEITQAKLKEEVQASRVLVTILDPYTFDSEWVRLEYEWASAGQPIVGLYDGDRFRWEQVSEVARQFPACVRPPRRQLSEKDYQN